MPQITVEEWAKELESLTSSIDPGGNTTRELEEMLRLSNRKVVGLLRDGVKAGKIAVSKRYVAPDWDGQSRWYTVYMPIKATKKGK